MTPLLLRLMIAAALAGTLSLCSLAIERMTGDKKTAGLREHPQEQTGTGSSLPATPKDIQAGWSIGPGIR